MPTAPLAEHGFWDYTTPVCGGMERYGRDDYTSLLDDMADAGMNSLVICPKWMTTGYRSRLPYLDQTPDNPVTASDNELLRFAIDQAHRRGIKVWLLAVLNIHVAADFGADPRHVMKTICGHGFPKAVGVYDSDLPGVGPRAAEIAAELVEQFPAIDGFIAELEADNLASPRRVPLYDAWAEANGRPPFDQLGQPLNPRGGFIPDWRDYTTQARIEVVQTVQEAIAGRGFRGELAVVCGLGGGLYERAVELNLEALHRELPDASAVTYGYEYPVHRYTTKDFGIALPKSLGLRTYYLPRGVMTWDMPSLQGIPLVDHWRMDVEDAGLFGPHGLWWFGSGTVNDGVHVSLTALRQMGFRDGVDARRRLLAEARTLREP